MKKIFISIILILIGILITYIIPKNISNGNDNRFIIIEKYDGYYPNYVFYDKNTKIMYYCIKDHGMSVLLDSNGKPLIYRGE